MNTSQQLADWLEAVGQPDNLERMCAAELRRLDAEVQALREGAPITDEQIDVIADLIVKGMPEGVAGFCKSWGWRQFARALLDDCAGHYRAAPVAQAAQGVPAGWKLVPVVPTPEMLKAADDGDDAYTLRNFGPGVQRVMQGAEDHWAAMLAATPAPAQAQQAEPAAWINWSALTGEPRLGWQCESELASEPLYRKAAP